MASIKEYIYLNSPYFIKILMINLQGFLNYRQRYNASFYNYFEDFKELWYKPLDEIETYQLNQLKELLIECYTYSPYYKELFKSHGVDLDMIKEVPVNALKRLPVLEKSARKEYVHKILNNNPNRPTKAIGHTSGTSGSPTINYLDKDSISKSFALWKRFHYSLGINEIHPKTIRFSGNLLFKSSKKRSPFWIYNIFEKQLYMSTYHLTRENIPEYLHKINKFKPELIDGYPSAIYAIAKYIVEYSIQLKFTPKAICTTSETLYDEQKIIMEKAFSCKVFNQYASSEGSPFITECIQGNLHLNLDSGFFELLDADYIPVTGEDQLAKLVVTSLRNSKTPLLRYDIKDQVKITNKRDCLCGCKMPIVKSIVGREEDLLIANNGSSIGMSAYKIFKYAQNLEKGQIIQKSPFDFELKVVTAENYNSKDEMFLIQKTKEAFGDKSNVIIKKVQDIPLGANGKFKAVIKDF